MSYKQEFHDCFSDCSDTNAVCTSQGSIDSTDAELLGQ